MVYKLSDPLPPQDYGKWYELRFEDNRLFRKRLKREAPVAVAFGTPVSIEVVNGEGKVQVESQQVGTRWWVLYGTY